MARQKPQIEIEDPILSVKSFLSDVNEKLLSVSESFKFYNTIVIAVFLLGFVILLFTLATLLIQAWQFNSTFQTEANQLRIQEGLIKNTVEQQKSMSEILNEINKKLNRIEDSLNKQ